MKNCLNISEIFRNIHNALIQIFALYPTTHSCILVLATLWHLICTNFLQWCYLGQMYFIFSIIIKKIDAENAHSISAIKDEFSKKISTRASRSIIFNAQLSLFGANKMSILVGYSIICSLIYLFDVSILRLYVL